MPPSELVDTIKSEIDNLVTIAETTKSPITTTQKINISLKYSGAVTVQESMDREEVIYSIIPGPVNISNLVTIATHL